MRWGDLLGFDGLGLRSIGLLGPVLGTDGVTPCAGCAVGHAVASLPSR
jgi:hypothetical protein